jgi:hypothetical protein
MQRGDEHGALDGECEECSFSSSERTSPIPSRSQIRANNSGPPMRLTEANSAPLASAASALMSST